MSLRLGDSRLWRGAPHNPSGWDPLSTPSTPILSSRWQLVHFSMESGPAQSHPPFVPPAFFYTNSSPQLTPDSLNETLPVNHYGNPTNQFFVIWKATHHSFSQQCRLHKWLGGEANSLKYPLPQHVWFRNRFHNRSMSVVTVTGPDAPERTISQRHL